MLYMYVYMCVTSPNISSLEFGIPFSKKIIMSESGLLNCMHRVDMIASFLYIIQSALELITIEAILHLSVFVPLAD